jgi:hypothetical protein
MPTSESIHLPVEQMLRDGRATTLDGLMYEIIRQGEKSWPNPDAGVWEISDRLAFHKGSKALWNVMKDKYLIKDLVQIHNELRPYAVCDLRRL